VQQKRAINQELTHLIVVKVRHLAVDVCRLPKGDSLDGSIRARVEEGGPGRATWRRRGGGRGGGGELQPEVPLVAGVEKVAARPCAYLGQISHLM
jgi:hypothetical protein